MSIRSVAIKLQCFLTFVFRPFAGGKYDIRAGFSSTPTICFLCFVKTHTLNISQWQTYSGTFRHDHFNIMEIDHAIPKNKKKTTKKCVAGCVLQLSPRIWAGDFHVICNSRNSFLTKFYEKYRTNVPGDIGRRCHILGLCFCKSVSSRPWGKPVFYVESLSGRTYVNKGSLKIYLHARFLIKATWMCRSNKKCPVTHTVYFVIPL